ncbi:MAG: hypothetical protein GY760_02300, partial [Deltaproteobacteria bacterium]|nr:hypothetical protein [Deltaproteobacteria bacterium]
KDELLKMLKISPFEDYIDYFKREYGIDLEFDESAIEYIISQSTSQNKQISDSLNKLMFGAHALTYMHIEGKCKISKHMLENPKYFDNLFSNWFINKKTN